MSGTSSSKNQLSLLENVALAAHYLDSNIYVRESLQEFVDLRNVPLEMYVRLEVKKYVSKYNTYESRLILERINNLETSEKKRKNETVEKCGKRPISSVSQSCHGEPVNKKVAMQPETSQSSRLKTAPRKYEAKRKTVTAQAPPSAPLVPIQRRRPNCPITALRRAGNIEEKMRARREEKENQKKEGERRAAEVMADFKRCREQRIKEAQERKKNNCI